MLDVYERREGSFELVDTQMIELRSKRLLYYRLIRFVIILLIGVSITLLLITFLTENFLWLLVLTFPLGLGVLAYRNLLILKNRLSPRVSSINLDFDKHKEISNFRIRKWQQTSIDEYLEENIRYNQAIGFKVIWYDDGSLEVEIIVDRDFPGTLIFETFNFYTIAELQKNLDLAVPHLDYWHYVYEDGTEWDYESIKELEEDIEETSVHWLIREYFDEI